MGSACSNIASLTGTGNIQVPVEARFVEEVIEDHSSFPSFVPHCISVDCIRPGYNKGTEGSVWRVVRTFQGRNVSMVESVTSVKSNPYTISLSFDLKEIPVQRLSAETLTLIVQPNPNNGSACSIIYTFAFVPAGLLGTIRMAMCRTCFISAMQRHLDEELQCYATEAIRRRDAIE